MELYLHSWELTVILVKQDIHRFMWIAEREIAGFGFLHWLFIFIVVMSIVNCIRMYLAFKEYEIGGKL